jgi:hypothetical protein
MGLDISNDDIDSYKDNVSYYIDEYINNKYKNLFLEYLRNNEYDKILNEITAEYINKNYATSGIENLTEEKTTQLLNNTLEEFKQTVQRQKEVIEILLNPEVNSNDRTIAEKYHWTYDDEETHDSRMGSYGMIHYGRKFADLVDKLYTSKGLDISNTDQVLTCKEVESLLIKIEEEGTMYYDSEYFDNLCNHSDCDSIYAPTQERVKFEIGSSIGLLKELDTLYNVKAIEHLKSIISSIETEQKGKENVKYASKEIQTLYNLASNCEWVIRKMLYHAVNSVENNEIICFC